MRNHADELSEAKQAESYLQETCQDNRGEEILELHAGPRAPTITTAMEPVAPKSFLDASKVAVIRHIDETRRRVDQWIECAQPKRMRWIPVRE